MLRHVGHVRGFLRQAWTLLNSRLNRMCCWFWLTNGSDNAWFTSSNGAGCIKGTCLDPLRNIALVSKMKDLGSGRFWHPITQSLFWCHLGEHRWTCCDLLRLGSHQRLSFFHLSMASGSHWGLRGERWGRQGLGEEFLKSWGQRLWSQRQASLDETWRKWEKVEAVAVSYSELMWVDMSCSEA